MCSPRQANPFSCWHNFHNVPLISSDLDRLFVLLCIVCYSQKRYSPKKKKNLQKKGSLPVLAVGGTFGVFRGLIWFLTPYLFISNSYSYYDLADREKDKFTLTFWSVSLAELPLSVTNKVSIVDTSVIKVITGFRHFVLVA